MTATKPESIPVVIIGKRALEEVTPAQAAPFLGVSRPTVYRLIDDGCLSCRRPSPGKILISVAILQAYREKTKSRR